MKVQKSARCSIRQGVSRLTVGRLRASRLEALIIDMKKELEVTTKWLKDFGLKVNESITEIRSIHCLDCRLASLNINQTTITSPFNEYAQ